MDVRGPAAGGLVEPGQGRPAREGRVGTLALAWHSSRSRLCRASAWPGSSASTSRSPLGGVGVGGLLQQDVREDHAGGQLAREAGGGRLQCGAGRRELAAASRPRPAQQRRLQRAGAGQRLQPPGRLVQQRPVRLLQGGLAQAQPTGEEVGPLRRDPPPLGLGVPGPALLVVHHGQVVPGLVAAQAGVDAGEVRARLRVQHLQEARLGPRQVAPLAPQQPFEEEKLRVVGADAPPSRTAASASGAWFCRR